MPKRGKLPRGRFFAAWRVYNKDNSVSQRSKIIDRDIAVELGLSIPSGPLTKTDARKVLEKLIADSSQSSAAPIDRKATLSTVARNYLDLNKPNWGKNTIRTDEALIESHFINGKQAIVGLAVRDITQADAQKFINTYVESNTSQSHIAKMKKFLKAILELAVDERLIDRNPARKLKGKSRKKSSKLAHTPEECGALYAVVSGRDHLVIRIAIQLGLRPEELFALRRNDVCGDEMVIDEALVEGDTQETKTLASTGSMYLPADLQTELKIYTASLKDESQTAWLFPASRKGAPIRPNNFLKRVLKPAAIEAGVCVTTDSKGNKKTAVNFQSLRRTSSTLFGELAKDPKSTQAHMRHADPQVTLRHYQQAIPSEVKAAAIALEGKLIEAQKQQEAKMRGEVANARPV